MTFSLVQERKGSRGKLYLECYIHLDCEKAPLFDMLTPKFPRYPGWFHKVRAEPGVDKITSANDVPN